MIDAPAFYRGIVSNDTDPEGLYRIKALVPQVFGNDTTETDWAWPVLPPGWTASSALVEPHTFSVGGEVVLYTGGGNGTPVGPTGGTFDLPHTLDFDVPPAGAGVWISFVGGDMEYPIWVGVWA